MKKRLPRIHCPGCQADLDPRFIASSFGRLNAARRTHAGGMPKKLKLCKFGCGKAFGARDMRKHLPQCPNRVYKKLGRPRKQDK